MRARPLNMMGIAAHGLKGRAVQRVTLLSIKRKKRRADPKRPALILMSSFALTYIYETRSFRAVTGIGKAFIFFAQQHRLGVR